PLVGEGRGEGEPPSGFDAVIGNPPYGGDLSACEQEYFRTQYSLQQYQLDTYMLFIEMGLVLANRGCFVGMIIPNTWMLNLHAKRIRAKIFESTQIEKIVYYRRPVFTKATVDTQVLVLIKKSPPDSHGIGITMVEKDGTVLSYSIRQQRWAEANGAPVNILERPEVVQIADKLRRFPPLQEFAQITQGAKPFQVGKGNPPQTRRVVEEKPYVATTRRDETFRPLLRGSLIRRYQVLWNHDYWISFGDWLAEPRYSAQYDTVPKIVIRQTGDSLVATIDTDRFVVRDNLYTIVPKYREVDLRFFLGLINSRLLSWYYQTVLNPERGEALAQVKRGHLAKLPVALPDPTDVVGKARRSKMVELVQRMLDLHKQLAAAKTEHEKTGLQRQIAATDRQIDHLVYELYGLTEEEIKIVEEAGK
ncbi:MAG: TaqI-like C-terminal specificity domain-containing protein, partial [Candidatus Bipolaricaulis anaerobius]